MANKSDSNVKNKKNKKNAVVAPSKKTMNFVHHQSSFNLKRFLIVTLILVVVIAVFAKFAVLDLLAVKTEAYQKLSDRQSNLTAIQKRLAGYDELEKQYGRYSYGWMSEAEISMVSRMDVLALIEKEVSPYAVEESIAVNNNVLTLNVRGITLEEASDIIMSMEEDPLVKHASVYHAVEDETQQTYIAMTVILTKEVADA